MSERSIETLSYEADEVLRTAKGAVLVRLHVGRHRVPFWTRKLWWSEQLVKWSGGTLTAEGEAAEAMAAVIKEAEEARAEARRLG